MLYGYFTFDIMATTAGSAMASPRRSPAIPQALERVWSTTRLGYVAIIGTSEGEEAKSM